MSKLTPLTDFIILELPANAESKILQLDAAKKKVVDSASLLVIMAGADCKSVKVGDRLIVDPQAIITFAFEKRQFFLTKEENACAVIRSENNAQ